MTVRSPKPASFASSDRDQPMPTRAARHASFDIDIFYAHLLKNYVDISCDYVYMFLAHFEQ